MITTGSPDLTGEVEVEVLHDLDGEAHRSYRITRPTLLLVRPDGHIAVRVAPREIDRLPPSLAA